MPILKKRRIESVCQTIIRNVAYYRAVQRPFKGAGNNFWKTVRLNFINAAVLDWCKIFAEEGGKHHWREIVSGEHHVSFFQDMMTSLGVTEEKFLEYVQSTKEYRNKFVAHLDDTNLMQEDAHFKAFPDLELLIESTKFLFKNVYPNHEPLIREYYAYAERSAREAVDG